MRIKFLVQVVIYIGLLLTASGMLAACTSSELLSQSAIPTPTIDRLAAPPLPEEPTQVELGAHVYYQVCMACHGDKGQGLTEEWRLVWEEDYNCWQSECHGNNHPPHGFSFPRTCCQAVIGPNTLSTYKNGQELFTYVSDTMPWWNPGYLTTEEFWQVTAFLMNRNGVLPEDVTLNTGNAIVFNLRPASPLPEDNQTQIILISGVLLVAASFLALQNRTRN